jgi:Domain of unknown function (DUF4357)
MLNRPTTIQFFLPQGEPRGVKIAEFTNRIPQAIYIPRNRLDAASGRSELRNAGIYFLFGDGDEVMPKMYVGEAEVPLARLRQHHANDKKGFWKSAVVFVSKTNHFTKSHIKYLEWLALRRILSSGRFMLTNSNTPTEPYTPEPLRADLIETFDTIEILLSVLGYPALEQGPHLSKESLFYCRARGCEARGELSTDGFVVYKGSTASIDETPTIGPSAKAMRKALIDSNILMRSEDSLYFSKDHIFSSPSRASTVVSGRSSNGWTEWKDSQGRTLHEVSRLDGASSEETMGQLESAQ